MVAVSLPWALGSQGSWQEEKAVDLEAKAMDLEGQAHDLLREAEEILRQADLEVRKQHEIRRGEQP